MFVTFYLLSISSRKFNGERSAIY